MKRAILAGLLMLAAASPVRADASLRPFGTLREQAEVQQQWLKTRMETVLPPLMRRYGAQMWVIPMREYNEDPVFSALVAPTTFSARRRTIYVFFDRGADQGVEMLALGGGSQGGVYTARRSERKVKAAVGGRQAELWGDEQWQMLKEVIEERRPRTIAINVSRTFAFADGLSAGEYEGMSEALGPEWTQRFRRAEGLAVDLIAARLPEEEAFYRKLNELTWQMISTAFSNQVITPGVTRTSDVVWWMRQFIAERGLAAWFQPSVDLQRQGFTEERLGEDPVIQKGDLLHCDTGIVALRLQTDTQHLAYVLKDGEREAPAGLKAALTRSNRLQDIVLEETRPGRTGNAILKASQRRMRAENIDGTIYSHPIGLHGHGAGPLIGLWDRQEGVPGRGDHAVIPNQWFSVELQATVPVAEWGGQKVRMAQEEDMVISADGIPRWAFRRQDSFWLVR
ncbi:MAG: aminopeptidase P family protein [Aphanocapsa lilacina HA4352-LM1]|jgi:Xaa-Pro aminopeptidase|nr:aminopeptidase P family protein [Aphanocapsa lilacina HA4352-LM1]